MQNGWRLTVKRTLDRAAAAVGLVITAPVLAMAAVAVRTSMGAPIFFRQQRPGLHAKPFVLIKLRTMRLAVDASGHPLPDEQRLTRVGKFLRATSLDELPQLINVLRGELSFVGPRPLLMSYLDRYTTEQARRHDVMPGITGWAQVNGRNAISWPEKLALDVWYVEHWSLLLDATILAKTVRGVMRRDGISSAGHATMPELPPQR